MLTRRSTVLGSGCRAFPRKPCSTSASSVETPRRADRRDCRAIVARAGRNQRRDEGPSAALSLAALAPFLAGGWAAAASAAELPISVSKGSYYVTLGLFAMTAPGLWSLVKRSAKSKIRRRTYSVPGPAAEGAVPLDETAQQIVRYFVNYNYRVESMTDVIRFVGNFRSSAGQAAQLVLYSFFGLGSVALVLSVQFPEVGNWWYLLTAISPLAGVYYWKQADREEEVKVKLVTSEDDSVTDIVVEGDEEELDRFRKELNLREKGKVYVRGVMER